MNFNQAKIRHHPEPIEPPTAPYPFETILGGDLRNVSHRRLAWSNWILTAFLLLAVIAAICEAF